MAKSIEDYFWRRVDKNGPLHSALGTRCWLWRGELAYGYGRFTYTQNGKRYQVAAHRFAWELANNKKLDRSRALHRCDVPSCVNPQHLYAGTAQQNMMDAMRRKRLNPARGEWQAFSKLTEMQVVALREDRAAGTSLRALSEKYGISKTVAALIYRGLSWKHVGGPIQGRPARPVRKLTKIQERQLVREYETGVLSGALAQKFNITRGTVNNILKRHAVEARSPGRPPGLTQKGVDQVRKMYTQQKMSMTAIARQFGVSETAIHRAIHGAYAPKHGIV